MGSASLGLRWGTSSTSSLHAFERGGAPHSSQTRHYHPQACTARPCQAPECRSCSIQWKYVEVRNNAKGAANQASAAQADIALPPPASPYPSLLGKLGNPHPVLFQSPMHCLTSLRRARSPCTWTGRDHPSTCPPRSICYQVNPARCAIALFSRHT